MSTDIKIHEAQTKILRELLFHKSANFASMQNQTGLSSDHFNFHINKLVELGLITKLNKGIYTLSVKGKEYANKLDTDSNTIERQPKIAVLLLVTKNHNSDDIEILVQQRLKQPFYGFWGLPSGKIRWGETILECAARELKEETNLQAKLKLVGIEHKLDYDKKSGELLEDKIFNIVHCYDVKGKMFEGFEGGKNAWIKPKDINNQLDKYFEGLDSDRSRYFGKDFIFEEKKYFYTKEEY